MRQLPLVQMGLPYFIFSGSEREKRKRRRVCARAVSKKYEESGCKQSSASSAERVSPSFFQRQQEKNGGWHPAPAASLIKTIEHLPAVTSFLLVCLHTLCKEADKLITYNPVGTRVSHSLNKRFFATCLFSWRE